VIFYILILKYNNHKFIDPKNTPAPLKKNTDCFIFSFSFFKWVSFDYFAVFLLLRFMFFTPCLLFLAKKTFEIERSLLLANSYY